VLREDACYMASLKRGDDTEDASQWMFEDAMGGGELTDMEFLLDSGRRVRGHKVWLMARCDYLRRMMTSGMRESETGIVRVRECGDGAFLALLEYMYTGRLGRETCLGQDWGELSSLADMFGMCGMEKRLFGAVTWSSIEEAALMAAESGRKQLLESCMKLVDAALGQILTVEEALTMMRVMEAVYTQKDEEIKGVLGIGMKAVVHTMRSFNLDAEVQARGCQAILQTARSGAENLRRAGQAGAVGIAIDVLRSLWRSSEVLMGACKLLGSLVRKCKENCEMAGNAQSALGVGAVAEFMAANQAQAEVQAAGFETICNLLEDNTCMWLRTLKRRMRDRVREIEKWITTFVDGLRAHRDDDEVQRAGTRALYYLLRSCHAPRQHPIDADGEAAVEAARYEASIVEHGAPGTVVRAMKQQRSNGFVQMICCYAIRMLVDKSASSRLSGMEQENQIDELRAWYEQNTDRAVRAGAFEAIVQGMEAHSGNARVQHRGCTALMHLAEYEEEENRRRGMEAGVVEVIVEAMHSHRMHASVQGMGGKALHQFPGRESVKRALNAGMVEAILGGMKAHQANAIIQAQGFRMLRRLFEMVSDWGDDDKGKIEEVRLRMVNAGAIGMTLQTMQRYYYDYLQQQMGIATLIFCVVNKDGGVDDWGMAPLILFGGIENILTVMEMFIEGNDLQMMCFPLLAKLLAASGTTFKRIGTGPTVFNISMERCRIAVDAGGIEVIVKAMDNCSENDECSSVKGLYGTMLLTALIGKNGENRHRVVEAGAIRTVTKAARITQCLIGRLLKTLVDGNPEYGDQARAAGAVEVLVDSMKRLELHPSIQIENFEGLSSICEISTENNDSAMNAGAIQAVIAILKKYACHAQVHIAGFQVLRTLLERAEDEEANIHRAVKAGVVDVAVQGIKIHADNSGVFDVGCIVLQKVFRRKYYDDEQDRYMKAALDQAVEAGAVEAILEGVDKNFHLEQVFVRGLSSLIGLMQSSLRISEFESPLYGEIKSPLDARHLCRALEAGAVETIVKAMKAHEECALRWRPELFRIIHALVNCDAWNPDRRTSIVDAGVIEVIVKQIEPFCSTCTTSDRAFQVLHTLLDADVSCRVRAVEAGAIEIVVDFIMDKNGSSKEFAVLYDIINVDQGSRVRAAEAGAIEAILGLLSSSIRFFDNARDFFDALEMLTSLVVDHPENCQRALNADVIMATTFGLQKHHADGYVQIVGCNLLVALLSSERAGHADRVVAANLGGIEAILSAIARNNIASDSMAALTYLGCKALLAIIGNFGTGSAPLRRQGQDKKNTLRDEYELCDRARRGGGIQTISDALLKFPHDAEVQAAGFETLMELMWDMPFGAYQIVTADGIIKTVTVSEATAKLFVQAAMNNHPHDVRVRRSPPSPTSCMAVSRPCHVGLLFFLENSPAPQELAVILSNARHFSCFLRPFFSLTHNCCAGASAGGVQRIFGALEGQI
jgi:hypothetical protein